MKWYLDGKHFGAAETMFPTTPTYEQRMTLIQGLEIWLSDPYLELKIARPKGHIDCPCRSTGTFQWGEGYQDHPWLL